MSVKSKAAESVFSRQIGIMFESVLNAVDKADIPAKDKIVILDQFLEVINKKIYKRKEKYYESENCRNQKESV